MIIYHWEHVTYLQFYAVITRMFISFIGKHKILFDKKEIKVIWLLFLVLLILTYINYKISNRDIFNPGVVFSAMFLLFSFFCCLANLFIGIDIEDFKTIIVILFGSGMFTFVNYTLGKKYVLKKVVDMGCDISSIWGVITIVIIIINMYIEYNYIMAFSAAYGFASDFFEAMVQYKVITTLKDADAILVPSPWYRGPLITVCGCFAYFSVYVFFVIKIFNNQFSPIYASVIILYIIYSLMGGGRSETFRVVTACIFIWYFFYRIHKGEQFNIKPVLLKIIFFGVAISLFFISFIYIVGRTQADMDFEAVIMSMFIYAGAPIFNLDIYLQNPWTQTHGIFGELTFIRLINWFGRKFGDSSLVYELDLPFLSYQNYDLGNVYTTFYAFIYDFGFMGGVVLTGIMAVVCVWLYNKVNYVDIMSNRISLYVICYAYLLNDIVMLPFSNRFYECTFNIGTWYKWVILFVLIKIINVSSKRQS